MKTLFNKTKKETVEYSYQINGGGEWDVKESGSVVLRFENGKFVSCEFPFCGRYTRNGFRILAEIDKEIDGIEEELAHSTESLR